MAKTSDKKFQIQEKFNRTFSESFKRQKIKDLEKGLTTLKNLCTEYQISRTSVYKRRLNLKLMSMNLKSVKDLF